MQKNNKSFIYFTMKEHEFLKGIIIGIAKIIPGLSGAVLMISFNLYDKAIDAITNFFNRPQKNFTFLFKLSLGIIIGISLFSNILKLLLTNYYIYTMSLFIGLILGGMPVLFSNITKNKNNYLLIVISFLLMSLLSLSGINNHYIPKDNLYDIITYFNAGILEAIGTIIPGISSTALLMLIGIYDTFLSILANATNILQLETTLKFLIPFSFGLIIGVIILSVLVDYLFKNYKSTAFSIIIGVSFSSVLILVINTISKTNNYLTFPILILIALSGYKITKRFNQ